MKKIVSIFFFVLMIELFIFELYCSIAGAIDINIQFAELAAREAGGHELLGVGVDIFVFGIVLLSAVGLVISLVSCKLAQSRIVRIVSAVCFPLFLLPILVSALILTI